MPPVEVRGYAVGCLVPDVILVDLVVVEVVKGIVHKFTGGTKVVSVSYGLLVGYQVVHHGSLPFGTLQARGLLLLWWWLHHHIS